MLVNFRLDHSKRVLCGIKGPEIFYTKPPWTRARASSRSEERRVTPLPLVAVQREQPLPRNGP